MRSLATLIPLALEGQWSGAAAVAVVLTSVLIFMGTLYYLLATIFGWRRAFHVSMVSLMGFMIILSLVWLVGAPGTTPGTGPRGREPEWIPFLAESEFGRDFRDAVDDFPEAWDEPGKKYFGNNDKDQTGAIDATGEIATIKGVLLSELAGYGQQEGFPSDDPNDYDFRLPPRSPEEEARLTPDERALPVATVRFKDAGGGRLLFGVTIPGVPEKHPEITVFALRDKGAVFLPSLYFLVVSIFFFALHLWLLARDEIKQRARDAETATTPSKVGAGT
ncbi:MAG: hypothetical protein ACRDKG_10995 [Actinomycetota bacterium]